MSKLDTHTYDGKIFIPDRKFNVDYKKDDKIAIIRSLSQHITIPTAHSAINLIINDIDMPGNHSPPDNLYADIILINIITDRFFIDNRTTLIGALQEQLSDIITSGQCAQGRTNRLMQIYLSLCV